MALMAVLPLRAGAAELLYFHSAACDYCERWDEEVGNIYNKTEEGAVLNLRPVDVHEEIPQDISHVKAVVYTPTFVALDDGRREIGRITGYAGDMFFWQHMEMLVKDMKKSGGVVDASCSHEREAGSKDSLSC